MTIPAVPVITIDGPSGVGKGTLMLRLARYLGWHTLDSGALYRVLALAAHRHEIAMIDDQSLVKLAAHLDVQFIATADLSDTQIFLEQQDVTAEIRTETCAAQASQLATLPTIRQALLMRQRSFRQPPGLVADGRDMGTVVFPDASCKLFLTASAEERALRRYKQLKEKEMNVNMNRLIEDIKKRDERDLTRSVAPLVPAAEAWMIDTTVLSIEEVMACVLQQVLTSTPWGIPQ
ncbi:MAG: cytidylate kinase [Beggiatoa sp. IS2]|nr:MAG: cytidylate kinase [Beggiatoa sp. IS2]